MIRVMILFKLEILTLQIIHMIVEMHTTSQGSENYDSGWSEDSGSGSGSDTGSYESSGAGSESG